jgi:hypothetical protein
LAQTVSGLDIAKHASAKQRDFPTELLRKIQNDLHPVRRACKATYDNSAFGLFEDVFESRNDRALRAGAPGSFGVGRVG